MSDDEDFPSNKLKGNEFNTDHNSRHSKWFKNKTRSRRSYYIVLTLLIFVFAALVLAVVGLSYVNLTATKQDEKTCTTEDCLRSAITIVESMNRSMDPCENFYEFACGNFGNLHRIPKSAFSNDRFSEVHDLMLMSIRDFMEKEDEDTEPYSVSQSRLLYRSCMKTDEMDAEGLKPLFQIMDKVGLPHLGIQLNGTNGNTDLNLSSILAKVKKHLGLNFLFTTNVEADRKNSTKNMIFMSKPKELNLFPTFKVTDKFRKMSLRKIRETLASEETVDSENNNEKNEEHVNYLLSYAKYFKGIWCELSNSNCSAKLDSEAKLKIAHLLMFNNEYSVMKGKLLDVGTNTPLVISVDKLQMLTDNITRKLTNSSESMIDWKQYLTTLFMDVENVTLDFNTDLIQMVNVEYFKMLFVWLSGTNKTQIINGLWWDVVTTLLSFTTHQMRFIQDKFYYETTGLENNPYRSIYCASAVNTMMGMAVSYLLVDSKSIDRNKNMVVEMMENIHWAFEKIVKELDWMDETTKERTMYKAQQMKTFVGFPELINDSTQLDDFYSDYDVVENDFFGNVMRHVQLELNSTLVRLRQLNDYSISSWASAPLQVNAYNWIQANAITIPAGILQFPFFGHDLQMLNYGFLGTILGHELTHGFDNTGRRFNHDGNENLWWTNQTIEEYEERTNCFIQHYESYVLPDIGENISGKSTLDENIADNGGLREALWAYRKFINEHDEEPKLPGLEEFNSEQLFYLAFANNWCETTTDESQSGSLLDEHSPNYVRVIGALTNSKEFSEVWKCGKGTKMNPKNEKCQIW